MKILITGANGFLGKNLQIELKNRGYEDFFLCDRMTSDQELKEYARKCDAVFHLAGINRPKDIVDFQVGNVDFTKKLVSGLTENSKKIQIVFASSIQVDQNNAYGRSKLMAEQELIRYAKQSGNRVCIFRLPNIFGKWARPNYNSVVATFCHNIARGLEIEIHDPRAEINLVYIDDVVNEFIEKISEQSEEGVFYCTIPEMYFITVGKLAECIRRYKNIRSSLELPDFSHIFEKKLYSTYLSYLEKNDFKYPLRMNKDDRGSFTEFIRTENWGQVSVNIAKPGIVKGNHWHHTKVEKFLVVSGEALIKLRNIITEEVIEFFVSGQTFEVVDIPVGYVHSITNVGKKDMIIVMWANEKFNREKPDTFPGEV